LGWICQGNQDNIQWQDKGSGYQIKDKIFQTRKMKYGRLHDRVWGLSYEGRYRQTTCNIFAEKKCITRYHEDHIEISAYCSTRDT